LISGSLKKSSVHSNVKEKENLQNSRKKLIKSLEIC
jgi:hypothetical protein